MDRGQARGFLYPRPGLGDHASGMDAGAEATRRAPFLADGLDRYGYLSNEGSSGLPVGFTVAGPEGSEIAGMTCAACHTRQIEVDGVAYRIDGGPAISISRASSPTSTRPWSRSVERRGASRLSRPRCWAAGTADDRDRAAPGGGRLVPALPHADGACLAGAAVGAGPARRGGDDLQPAHRPRSRASRPAT